MTRAYMTPTSALIAALMLGAVCVAQAQVVGPNLALGQTVSVSAGAFWADVNTVARAGGAGGQIGTRVDVEKELGLQDYDVRWIGGLRYQINRRNGIELSYFDLNRNADRTLTADFDFANGVFNRQATVHTSFDTEIWRLSYSYAFADTPRQRATVQVGLHYPRLDIRVSRASGTNILGETNSAEAKAQSPLPVIGMGYAYRISPRWMVDLEGQIFRLKVNDMSGSINNLSAVVAVSVLRNTNLFLGYNYYAMDVEISKQLWNGQGRLDYQGPWAGIVVGFGGGS